MPQRGLSKPKLGEGKSIENLVAALPKGDSHAFINLLIQSEGNDERLQIKTSS